MAIMSTAACRRTLLLAGALASLLASAPAAAQGSSQPRQEQRFEIYVTNETGGTLSIVDGRRLEVVATVPLGKRPRGLQASPDGKLLYVALSGSPRAGPGVDPATLPPADKSADGIGVVDVAGRKLLRVLRGVSDPEQLVVSRDGTRLYVASEDTGTAVVMDAATGARIAEMPVGGEPEGVGIRPDGKFVYMTSEEDHTVAVIDTERNVVVSRFKVGLRPRAVAFSHDGTQAYVTGENDASLTVVDALRHKPVQTLNLGSPALRPMGVTVAPPCGSVLVRTAMPGAASAGANGGARMSPDCGRIFVATGRGKSVVRVQVGELLQVVDSVDIGERPWGIDLSPDGRYAYTANGPSNDISVIDTRTMKRVADVPVGERPWGVLVLPR